MKLGRIICLVLSLSLLCLFGHAQNTYLYKRVMIVDNGNKMNKNDDAHYITFTDQGCYESDKDGFASEDRIIKFIKDENGNHYYYGSCIFGKADYYFSNDYSRLNIQLENNLIYVYQREPSGTTTAQLRGDHKKSDSGGTIFYVPVPTINGDNGTSGGTSSPKSSYIKCHTCNGTGNCSSCKGKGHSSIWGEKYQKCMSCNGSGRCTVCHGTGRIISY